MPWGDIIGMKHGIKPAICWVPSSPLGPGTGTIINGNCGCWGKLAEGCY